MGRFFTGFFSFVFFTTSVFASMLWAGETSWNGLYVQGQIAHSTGEHTLSYALPEYNINADVYAIPLKGSSQAIGLGYRHELFQSNVYLGVRAMAHFGELSGGKAWSAFDDTVHARASFSSKTVYAVGVEVGTTVPDWYLYAGGGMAGAELSLAASLSGFDQQTAAHETGWAIGHYAALGAMRAIGPHWAVGGELQWFRFTGKETVQALGNDLGNFTAKVEDTRLAVTVSYRF